MACEAAGMLTVGMCAFGFHCLQKSKEKGNRTHSNRRSAWLVYRFSLGLRVNVDGYFYSLLARVKKKRHPQ